MTGPKTGLMLKVIKAGRILTPAYWDALKVQSAAMRIFWRNYEG